MNDFIFIAFLCLTVFLLYKIWKLLKFPKMNCLSLIDGGVKCGKSTMAVAFTLRKHKKNMRTWHFKCFLAKLFRRQLPEQPLIYSNIPLACDYVELTEDLILRKKRFRYGSVVYINEASLLADSQLFRDIELNERLQVFNKLIGHELKGGNIIYDTQSLSDLHYSMKRCLSEYFYIHHLVKWVPFFLIAYVRECRYSDDGSAITVDDTDIEEKLKLVIIPKSTWKKFDAYAFSVLTDSLQVEDTIVDGKSLKDLKIRKILSFRKFKTIPKEYLYEEENDN